VNIAHYAEDNAMFNMVRMKIKKIYSINVYLDIKFKAFVEIKFMETIMLLHMLVTN
jgi:hypothetical protein